MVCWVCCTVGLKKGKICFFFYDRIWNLNLNCIEVTVNLTRFVINLVFFFKLCHFVIYDVSVCLDKERESCRWWKSNGYVRVYEKDMWQYTVERLIFCVIYSTTHTLSLPLTATNLLVREAKRTHITKACRAHQRTIEPLTLPCSSNSSGKQRDRADKLRKRKL